MVSALLMFGRFVRVLRHAFREEGFAPVIATGAMLILVGTLSYALAADWSAIDAFYFAVATLTTTSVADPDLVLDDGALKVFTVFYQLIGIGILVEILRRLGLAFAAVRMERRPFRRAPAATDE